MSGDWRHEFLTFCVECDVLRFGDFTLKSGRSSPYFFVRAAAQTYTAQQTIYCCREPLSHRRPALLLCSRAQNAGLFNTGLKLAKLGNYYARAIHESELPYDVLLGPAYKGIPLVSAASIGLAQNHGVDAPYCFNRKEAKDHGEGGTIVGSPLKGRALVIDDVITAGTAVRESAALVSAQGATLAGIVVALDREERGDNTELTAIEQVRQDLGVPVVPIATLAHLISFLEASGKPEEAARLQAHRQQYGPKA